MSIFNNLNSSTETTEFGILDIITIAGFLAQIDNMNKDDIQNNFIHKVIKAIADEIEKLHKENDKIMEQNEIIIEILKNREVN